VSCKEVGAAFQGSTKGFLAAPSSDFTMVSADQDFGNALSSKLSRAGVVRMFQQGLPGEGFVERGLWIAQNTVPQPGDRIDDDQSSQLASRENIVSDRDLAIDMGINAGIQSFVVATYQRKAIELGQFLGEFLIEGSPPRPEQIGPLGLVGRADGLDAFDDWRHFHHHATSSPKGKVIDGSVTIMGVLADVVEVHAHEALGSRPS